MTSQPRPPRLARWIAGAALRGEMREIVIGDLDEEFASAIGAGTPPQIARRRYWRQALASIAAPHRWREPMPAGFTTDQPQQAAHRSVFQGIALDLRHGIRVLARARGFSAAAVLTLALGIGVNTTVYNVIRAVLLEPLPVERPHELALIHWAGPKKGGVTAFQLNSITYVDPASGQSYSSNFTFSMFDAIRTAVGTSADLFAYNILSQLHVSIAGQAPVVVSGLLASGNYFSTMRLETVVGRPFGKQDDRADAPAVVVLGHGFWMRTLGGDPAVVGKVIRVNGMPFQVIGVTKPGYRGLSPSGFLPATDLTIPLSVQPAVMPRWSALPDAGASLFTSNLFWVRIMGRVSGASSEVEHETTAALRHEYGRLPGAETADVGTVHARVLPGGRGLDGLRTDRQRPFLLLTGVAAIVLLIACMNLSGLMLARGVSRQRELAVRRALGAGRWRLIRVLMIEGLLLSAVGGALSLLLAVWAAPLVIAMLTTGLGVAGADLGFEWPLVAIAATISIVAAVLSGLIPALRLSGRLSTHLSHRAGAAGPRLATGRALIAVQIAVSVPLLVGAGLLLRTVHNLTSADLGFDPTGLVIVPVDPSLDGTGRMRDPLGDYQRILERMSRLPGVRSATLVENVLIGGRTSNTDVLIDGARVSMRMNAVGPRFFETMGIPIVAGRTIGPEDRAGAPVVVVINEAAAARYFPGESALGRRFRVGKRDVEIVGIAATSRYRNLRTPLEPSFYDSYAQRAGAMPGLEKMLGFSAPGKMHVVLRSSAAPSTLARTIPATLAEVKPDLAITTIKTQIEHINDSIGRERMFTQLLVIFGGFAVVLACTGLYGVTAYAVARRTSEIGIRIALGARRTQVLWLILRQVLVLALAGVALGVPIALAAGPVVESLLFGLAARDAVAVALAVAVMMAVALAAGWLPARRASRLEVLAALRYD